MVAICTIINSENNFMTLVSLFEVTYALVLLVTHSEVPKRICTLPSYFIEIKRKSTRRKMKEERKERRSKGGTVFLVFIISMLYRTTCTLDHNQKP